MALTCSNCGKELPDNARFCAGCGSTVRAAEKEIQYCAKCGYGLAEDARFCLYCGSAVTSDDKPSYENKDDAIFQELFKSDPIRTGSAIYDFKEHETEASLRAVRWAEYELSGFRATDWFGVLEEDVLMRHEAPKNWPMEKNYFPTNRPNTHKALFVRKIAEWYISHAALRGFLVDKGDKLEYAPQVIAYYKNRYGDQDWFSDEYLTFHMPDYTELDELAKKDDELFPPPEPIRVEVAGAILNFATDEGVLVVYMDCFHSGKHVTMGFDNRGYYKTEVLERSGGVTICAAIFSHIPFVTDEHRNRQEVLKQLQVSVNFSLSENEKWEEKVTLFPGKVAELDWRGRTPQPKVQPQPQPTTIPATPSNTATLQGAKITMKRVEHNADECVYYIEVEDPGYLDGVLPAEIYSPLGEEAPAQTSSGYGAPAQASAGGGYAIAASDASPSYQSSYTPLPAMQKKKGTRLYVRNVKKR